jgi:predicted NBD/HSP70 family sugar kinase
LSVYVGLDIGGTKLVVAAADAQGTILRKEREPTPLNLEAGLGLLGAMIERVAGGRPIAGIGAAIGGPLDWRSGVVSPLHQPAWRDVPLRAMMESRWGCPFFVDVDTNVAALGEYGADPERPSRFLYMTISTGVGGGFLLDGSIYRGAAGAHPEVGHQSIPFRCAHPERVSCECGLSDCLEGLVSGNGIRRVYGKPAEALDESEWEEVAYNLGQGLRNVAAIYAPDVIVLGGGVALGKGEWLAGRAAEVMARHLRIVPAPVVRLSRLGPDAPLLGALAIAREGSNR